MKRCVSVVISMLLVMTSLIVILPTATSAGNPTGQNLIVGGNFTDGTGYTTSTTLPAASDSYVTGLSYRTWFRATALPGAIANNSDEHGNYLKGQQNVVQAVPLQKGATYTVSLDVKGVTGGASDLFEVYVASATARGTPLGVSGVTIDGIAKTTTGRMQFLKTSVWTTHTITFTVTADAPASAPFALVFFDSDFLADTNVIGFNLDNVSLYEGTDVPQSNLVHDGGFEVNQNESTAYSTASTTVPVVKQMLATTLPNTFWHQGVDVKTQFSRITSEDAHTGTHCAIVNSYLHHGVSASAGKTYRLTFWAKAKTYQSLSFRFVSTDSRATAINVEGSRSAALANDWAMYTYILTMPASFTGNPLLSFYTNITSGDYVNYDANSVYLDDVSLEEAALYTMSAKAGTGGTASVSKTTAVQGDAITFTATANTGYTFTGWFKAGQTQPVSTSNSYVVTASEDLSLTAKFQTTSNDMIFDGSFDQTTTIAPAESYSTVTLQSAHIWYQPTGSSSIQTENGNKYATLQEWIYQSVDIQQNVEYQLTYKTKSNTGAATLIVLKAMKDRSKILQTIYSGTSDGAGTWKQQTITFTVPAFLSGYTEYSLGFMGASGAGISYDDIILTKVPTVGFAMSAIAEAGGTAGVSKTSANSGEQVTFTATPNGSNTFLGWYKAGQTQPVSTNAVYTVTASENLTLTAKFNIVADPVDPNELLYDGAFNRTSSIAQAVSYDTATYENSHIWYLPSGASCIQTENGNPYATLRDWMYQSIKIESGKTYFLTFKSKSNAAGVTFSCLLRALKDRSKTLKTVFSETTDGKGAWKQYTYLFTVDSLLSGYSDYVIGFTAAASAGVSVDDISLKEASGNLCRATAAAFRGGSATASATIVVKGTSVTFSAEPNSGNTFRGWYLNGNTAKAPVSKQLQYTVNISSDLLLVAVFDGPGIPHEDFSFVNPDAETGTTAGWSSDTQDATFAVSSSEKHSGKYAFQFDQTANQKYVWSNNAILLKSYQTYEISVWVKSLVASPRFALFAGDRYLEGQNDFIYGDSVRSGRSVTCQIGNETPEVRTYSSCVLQKSTSSYAGESNGWVQLKMTFTTNNSDAGLMLKICLRNHTGVGTIYFDDLKVTETPIDVNVKSTANTYCEWIYNQVKNPSFENSVTENDWGSVLPKGWSLQNSSAANGSKYLKASGADVYYKKITVKPGAFYYFGASLKATAQSGSYIGLASDTKGTLFVDNNGNPASYLASKNTGGKWQRGGFSFMMPEDISEVYLVISNLNGILSVDDVMLCTERYAKNYDPNDYSAEVQYDYNGNGNVARDNFEETGSNNVPTGDQTAGKMAVLLMLLVASTWTMFMTYKKKGAEEQ